ncbi:MAG: folate-binding protein [Actinobacteria bacterium]|nr:folate-binding protein [Actinomycetota bacterium]MSW10612.1 folate-binding protein [Actinomycetota bacterium]
MVSSLDLPQAVAGPAGTVDESIAWHFGDPHREQRLLVEGVGIVDISNRGVVTVTGPDRLTWLHTLTTQHLENLQPNESALVLILSPHGHVEHELHLVDDGETSWLIVEPGTADSLENYLKSMQFMLRVEITNVTSQFAVVWEPISAVDALHPTWLVPEPFAGRGLIGREVIIPRADLNSRLEEAPAQSGSWALEALRVAATMPRMGAETDHKTLPHEVGWIGSAVHLQKGCYRGQETVARVQNLGKPPRRLVLLHLDGSAEILPGHGARVFAEDKEVGWVGTGARHYELGPVATAIVKRNVPIEAILTIRTDEGEVPAAQENFLTI